ncbi:hypothetical protein MHK_007616 [Candidatus Magnetomorum sp. HK-1]|nr:hypothetical protein MHK_007616 [Candidatus Magnetomorum sp. HK-1]
MRIQLYIDEDAMAKILVKGLRARGIDVVTVFEEDMTGCADEEQLEYATNQKRTLYTFNVGDFCRIHKEYLTIGKFHAGIVVVNRTRYSVGDQIKRLSELIHKKSAEEMNNNLLFL